jgi:hypothetical protein
MNPRDSFKTLIAEPASAGPTLYVGLTMRSEIQAIPPLVDRLMYLIRMSPGDLGDHEDVEIALREALANTEIDWTFGKRSTFYVAFDQRKKCRLWLRTRGVVLTRRGSPIQTLLEPGSPAAIAS